MKRGEPMKGSIVLTLLVVVAAACATAQGADEGSRIRIKPRGERFWRPLAGFILFTCELMAPNMTSSDQYEDYEEYDYNNIQNSDDSEFKLFQNSTSMDTSDRNESDVLDFRDNVTLSVNSSALRERRRRQDRRRERNVLEHSTLHWLDKEGFEILPGKNESTLVYVEAGTAEVGKISKKLYITHIQNHHAGFYTCFEKRNGRRTELSAQVKLMLYREIQFESGPEQVEGIVGRPLLIPCKALGQPVPSISWRFKDKTIDKTSESRIEMWKDGLYIRSVNKSDEGLYRCRAEVENTGNYKEKIISLIIRSAPMFAVDMGVIYGIQGESLLIQCKAANGFPPPLYSFHRNESVPMRAWTHELPPQNLQDVLVNSQTGLVEFLRISKTDEGQYVCMAENEAGRAFSTLTLKVHNGPTITEFNSVREIRLMTATLVCKAEGSPPPNITFYRISQRNTSVRVFGHDRMANKTELFTNYSAGWNEDDRVLVTTVQDGCATLYIKDLRLDDAGEYLCRTRNRFGVDEQVATLDVVAPPVVVDIRPNPVHISLGQQKNLTCSFISDPIPSLVWKKGNTTLKNNDTFSIYYTDKFTVLQITMLRGSDSSWLYGVYTCQLENLYGTAHLDIEVEGSRPPLALQRVSASLITTSSVRLRVSLSPNDTSLSLQGYQVQYDDVTIILPPNNTLIVDSLRPSTGYILHIRAVNEYGAGEDYKISFITHNLDVPFPVHVTSSNRSSSPSSYNLTWEVPDDGGRPIQRYDIRYRRVHFLNDTFDPSCVEPLERWRFETLHLRPSEVLTHHRLTDLRKNSVYQLYILAENEFGWSNTTESFFFVTMRDFHQGFDEALFAAQVLNSVQSQLRWTSTSQFSVILFLSFFVSFIRCRHFI